MGGRRLDLKGDRGGRVITFTNYQMKTVRIYIYNRINQIKIFFIKCAKFTQEQNSKSFIKHILSTWQQCQNLYVTRQNR